MKKTFRRALACLLAVLMVAFSMPFTAFAAKSNREWWIDDGVDPSTLTEEPDFVGYNDDSQELGSWEFEFGKVINLTSDEAIENGWEDHRDDYKPIIGVIVSNQGDASITKDTSAKYYNTFYGASTTYNYDKVKADGNILNPAQLKAGQRIAVTLEMGGFDVLLAAQFLGKFDNTALKPAYYNGTPFSGRNGRDTWTYAADTIIKTGATFYPDVISFAGGQLNPDFDGTYGRFAGFMNGNELANGRIENSVFIGTGLHNSVGTRSFGKYGFTSFTYSFEVLRDCDLKDVFWFDGSTDGTIAETYARQTLAKIENWEDVNEGLFQITMDDHSRSFAHFAVVWDSYDAGDDPQPTHEHTYTAEVTPPTCTEDGYTTYTCNNEDGLGAVGDDVYTEPGEEKLGHDFQWKELATTTATCTEAGTVTKQLVCTRCDATDGDAVTENVGEPLDHDYKTVEVSSTPATCTEAATVTTKDVCSRCGDEKEPVTTTVGEPLGHDYIVNEEVTTAPTFTTEGVKTITTTCSRCDYKDVKTEPIPVLEGYAITVPATTLGTVTVNGETVSEDGATVYVAKDAADVTLTATPVADAEFLGWKVNDQIVSTDAEYTFTAVADVTIEPVFQEEVVVNEFTVTFTDRWGNILSTQTVTSGADIVKPVDPTIDGYTFAGWSLTDEQIAALEADATILAVYNHDASKVYTVTAKGATITGEGVETKDTVQAGYNALVTVTAEGATAWKMNGAIVGYGDTYTFYVGSDVVVEAVYDAVTATPTVAAVSTTEIGTPGLIKASFLATRTMADGYTYSNAGFVYGKNLADNNITLADVDGTTVKAYYCTTNAEQFALNYGVASQTGTLTARAFLAYVDNATGESQVVYAEPQTYTYR